MRGHGKPAVANSKDAGSVFLVDVAQFEPALIEKQRHPGDVITPIASRIVSKALAEGKEVVLLCRRNGMPWFINFREHGQGGKGLSGYLELVRSFFLKASLKVFRSRLRTNIRGSRNPLSSLWMLWLAVIH